jgi:hypothetical protein
MSRKYWYGNFLLKHISAYNMEVGGKMGFGGFLFEWDGTWWRMGGEVKGKQETGVGIQ